MDIEPSESEPFVVINQRASTWAGLVMITYWGMLGASLCAGLATIITPTGPFPCVVTVFLLAIWFIKPKWFRALAWKNLVISETIWLYPENTVFAPGDIEEIVISGDPREDYADDEEVFVQLVIVPLKYRPITFIVTRSDANRILAWANRLRVKVSSSVKVV